jgi:hypothetical protein
VNANGTLTAQMGSVNLVTSQTPLDVGTWYQVTVFFMYNAGKATASISLGGNVDTPSVETRGPVAVTYAEATTDKFRITGFLGTINNFNIYSPGSPKLSSRKTII